MYSEVTITVNLGTGSTSTFTIPLPPSIAADSNTIAPGNQPSLVPSLAGLVDGIRRNGAWDTSGNYWMPGAIIKITPS
jgi:hypothetical protein